MKYIISDQKILSGEKVIVGTRIPAERLARLMEQGYTPANLAQEFPHVNKRSLQGAVKELTELTVQALQTN